MDLSRVWIQLEERPAMCGLTSCGFALIVYLLFGFWILFATILAVTAACVPSYIVHRYLRTSQLRRETFLKAFEARLLREIESTRADVSTRPGVNTKVCPVCSRSDCKRHQPTAANDYISEHELWMKVEIGGKLNEAIAAFLDRLIDEFVRTWYDPLSNDPDFILEVRRCARHILAQIATRLRRIDVPQLLVTRIIPLLVRHLELYNLGPPQGADPGRTTAGSMFLCRYFYELLAPPSHGARLPGTSRMRDAMQSAVTYRRRILNSDLHIALFSRYTEINYVRRLLDELLSRTDLLPSHARTSEATLVIFREVLAVSALVPALDSLAEPQFINVCLYKLFEPADSAQDAPTEKRTVRVLERFVPARVGPRLLREAHFVTIGQLPHRQQELYQFMQFLRRAGALRYLQLCLNLDSLNNELLSAEWIENAARLLKFRNDLAELLVNLREHDVQIVIEATIEQLNATVDSETTVNVLAPGTKALPIMHRFPSYTAELRSLPNEARERSSSQPERSGSYGTAIKAEYLRNSSPRSDTAMGNDVDSDFLASRCTYAQIIEELQRVINGPPAAVNSLLKSFCTLRLFNAVQTFLETSCLREFYSNEAQFRRRFGQPLSEAVQVDHANWYVQQSRDDMRRRRRAGAAQRSAASKATARHAANALHASASGNALADSRGSATANPTLRSVSTVQSISAKDKDAPVLLPIPITVSMSSGWSARFTDTKSSESATKGEETTSRAKLPAAVTAESATDYLRQSSETGESERAKSPKCNPLQSSQSNSLEDLLDDVRPQRDRVKLRSGETDGNSELSARSYDARSSSPSCSNPPDELQIMSTSSIVVEPDTTKESTNLDAYIDDFETIDEDAELNARVDPRSEDETEKRMQADAASLSARPSIGSTNHSSNNIRGSATGSDSFLLAADPEVGVPDLSLLSISISCIEQRPIARRDSRKKAPSFFSAPSASLLVEEHELVAFFIIEVEYTPQTATKQAISAGRRQETKPTRWRVARRYFEFYQLEEKLHAFHGAAMFGGRLPPRERVLEVVRRSRSLEQQLVDRMEYFDSLRPAFEKFLSTALSIKQLRNSQLLFLFLAYRHVNTATTVSGDVMTVVQPAQNAHNVSKKRSAAADSRSLRSLMNVGSLRSSADAETIEQFGFGSAEFAHLFNRSNDSIGNTGINWERLKSRMHTSFISDKKRQLIEPFMIAFARSVEPPPAKPSFGRYESQQTSSLERRILNNAVYRHARWNDRFELDIVPALHALSLDEVWVADETTVEVFADAPAQGTQSQASASTSAMQNVANSQRLVQSSSGKVHFRKSHGESHVELQSLAHAHQSASSVSLRERASAGDTQSSYSYAATRSAMNASDENEMDSTSLISPFDDVRSNVVLPGDDFQSNRVRNDKRFCMSTTDSVSQPGSATVSFVSAVSSFIDARSDNGDDQEATVRAANATAQTLPLNSVRVASRTRASVDMGEQEGNATSKTPFDYFAAFIVLVSRYFTVHPFFISLLNGLYRIDMFLSRILLERLTWRSVENGGLPTSGDTNAHSSTAHLANPEQDASREVAANSVASDPDSAGHVTTLSSSSISELIISLCHVERSEPHTLVNSIVHFLLRDKLERTLYDEQRLVKLVNLVMEAVFSPGAAAPRSRSDSSSSEMSSTSQADSGSKVGQAEVVQLLRSFYTPLLQTFTVNEKCYENGIRRLLSTLQDPQLNKLLSYQVLDCILLELFPELDRAVDS